MMNWSDIGTGTAPNRPEDPTITVNVFSAETLLADLGRRMQAGEGFSVATLNLDHVVKIRRLPDFRAAYATHSHVTADGNPIVWLSRLAGQTVHLVPGSELVEPVADLAARHGVPVALFGSTEATLDVAAARLEANHPGLRVVARIAPPMGFDPTSASAETYADQIAASGARLCILALGAPKQEMFAAMAQVRHPNLGFLSIGAGLDFIAGSQIRAPKIVRLLAAEWLWRLASNPGRLAGRYGACFAILPRLTVKAIRQRGSRGDNLRGEA